MSKEDMFKEFDIEKIKDLKLSKKTTYLASSS